MRGPMLTGDSDIKTIVISKRWRGLIDGLNCPSQGEHVEGTESVNSKRPQCMGGALIRRIALMVLVCALPVHAVIGDLNLDGAVGL